MRCVGLTKGADSQTRTCLSPGAQSRFPSVRAILPGLGRETQGPDPARLEEEHAPHRRLGSEARCKHRFVRGDGGRTWLPQSPFGSSRSSSPASLSSASCAA